MFDSGNAWQTAVSALALFAVDPLGLGGVVLRAPAGTVRDRWLALLREALPPGSAWRRIPLHAGDERVLGGLDLAATLAAGRPVERPGLLAEADGGVVVLAMAERIERAAAARLCAALDDAAVTLQRDGLTRDLPARCAMIALDEGIADDERPPSALLDRLAFLVDLNEVSWRELDAPSWRPADLERAREAVGLVGDNPNGAEALCHAAVTLGVDSLRAPLFALRAARVQAALCGRAEPSEDDLGLAARLVLAPRATRLPPGADDGAAPEQSEAEETPSDQPSGEDATEAPVADGVSLEDLVLAAAQAALPADLLAGLASNLAPPSGSAGRAGQTKTSKLRGRPIGAGPGEPRGGARLHVLETLKAAAPWQGLRRSDGASGFVLRREDFRIMRFRQRSGTTTVFAVDASGSAALNRLAEAKGAVELLLADCYVRRDQVALIAFRGLGASLLLPPTGSLLRAKRSLAGLPGGGPTPLAAGLEAAVALAESVRRGGRTPVITVLTDGRANITRDGNAGRERAEAEAMEVARALRAAGHASLMVDTSPRPNPFARRLAEVMGARYVPLPYVGAAALAGAVRSAAAA